MKGQREVKTKRQRRRAYVQGSRNHRRHEETRERRRGTPPGRAR